MRVRRKFIKLTKKTYPYGTENQLKHFLPKGYKTDEHGNFYLEVGENPTTMFTCHLDTACDKQEKVNHVFHSEDVVGTDGTTILGADDKAGMVVLLYMIEKNVPGLYYFFIGEEVGCIGSGDLSTTWTETEFSNRITKVVSFDRRGTDSVITEQAYGRCASDEFAIELSKRLNSVDNTFNFSPDNTGILTDSINFMDMVPECTNISVGYYNEHGGDELQDLSFLKRLCRAVCEFDWETLPVSRDPLAQHYYEDEEDDDSIDWSKENFSYFDIDGKTQKMYISNSQIRNEVNIINNWLRMSCAYPGFDKIDWNGNYLYVGIDGVMIDVGERYDLVSMIPDLNAVGKSQLRKYIISNKINAYS